jgi:hypothetical protein
VSSSILSISQGDIAVVTDPGTVWRVGYRPDPWTWTPWQYAENGRFNGRWDDPDGNYRTLYTGTTLLGCLLEVLARFRPDPALVDELDGIIEDPDDQVVYPTPAPGIVPRSWLLPRTATTGTLIGTFCAVTNSATLAALRPLFLGQALRYGLPDFDAAALRLAKPRALTQTVSSFLYATTIHGEAAIDGVQFQSRYGDELTLIAIFERGSDFDQPAGILATSYRELRPEHPDLVKALALHHLQWDQ